jgi:hypothetical protein
VKARRMHKPHASPRVIGRRKRPGESTAAFQARVAPELRQHERTVRRRELGLDAPPTRSAA